MCLSPLSIPSGTLTSFHFLIALAKSPIGPVTADKVHPPTKAVLNDLIPSDIFFKSLSRFLGTFTSFHFLIAEESLPSGPTMLSIVAPPTKAKVKALTPLAI